ncbi:MAG: M42 family metallopeptidase [Candidatus Altiarchaeota archaeon]|nr:M42 family metallopeptidase [Candidatus Altiarchaeota archaeon]
MDLLEKLCMAPGISGYEECVADIMVEGLKKTCDEVRVDGFGNVIGRRGSGNKKIMLAAHMDEVGFLVKNINKEGYLSFVKVGGIDDRVLYSQRVIVKAKKGDIVGVIGAKPPHLQKAEERKKVIQHEELFIDVGATSKKEAEKMVEIGDPVIFEPNYGILKGDIHYGKAVDNRLGCYVMLKVMEKLPKKLDATVYAIGSCQEEVGLKGARVAAYAINPDYAIALDTTLAGDTPGIKENESNLKIGKGPSITIMEASGRGVITHPKVRDAINKASKKAKIPVQIDVLEGGMTDAAIIYLTREGIPSGVISVPTRYLHGPSSVFNMKDVNNAVKLTLETVKNL